MDPGFSWSALMRQSASTSIICHRTQGANIPKTNYYLSLGPFYDPFPQSRNYPVTAVSFYQRFQGGERGNKE
ncbi:hypothetical protein K435DRAFT_773675 [Dendrothele bispora CBS 962.96]|uniref:Uncharacterized protein n=1 Tax=Dendrothele bispora (strain CBS 962.96) TaxID=1314807 RepID=A0A4S8MRL6_DENBC|nr:hypothetical protein K435DRAFT_773675 [Dendrothele bispora CBS 962.96]